MPRSIRWAIAALLIVGAAAAGIAANVVLLGLSQQGAADPVGHFKPQLGLASATDGTTFRSVPRPKDRAARELSHGPATTTTPSSFDRTAATAENDDD